MSICIWTSVSDAECMQIIWQCYCAPSAKHASIHAIHINRLQWRNCTLWTRTYSRRQVISNCKDLLQLHPSPGAGLLNSIFRLSLELLYCPRVLTKWCGCVEITQFLARREDAAQCDHNKRCCWCHWGFLSLRNLTTCWYFLCGVCFCILHFQCFCLEKQNVDIPGWSDGDQLTIYEIQ